MKHLSFIKKKLTAAAASAAIAATSAVFQAPSVTVSAAENNYYEALAMSLYMYDANACGKGITDGPLTWRGDCHTYDAEASIGDLDSSLRSVVDPDGNGKVDVSGGFHDAGDHIKFNLTIGFGMSSLAMSDYLNPGVYEKAGCKDHLIYELKWGSDYLMKTTFLDSSGKVAAVAHVVANGGEDHAIWSAPEVQTYARPIYWLTANKNNSAVCCEMAAGLAGTAYVVKDSDPEYSAKCIKYAKALLEFGQKHVGNEGGGLSDYYGTEDQYQDEETLAQAWLWINEAGSKPTRVPKNKDYGNSQYDGWVFCWNKVWQGYSAMMYKATGDQVFADELKVELQSQGDLRVGTYNADGWGASRYNCAKQMDALAIANGDPDAEYAKAAKYQMDHILGDNSLGYSFLLGYGDKWPVHIHHRAANPGTDANGASSNPSAKYTAYGLLVGGDDKNGYQDQTDKYQYTEGALDYNGCFAIACAGIANLYGGDASAMDKLAKSASEINESFKFGSSNSNTTTETTPVTTTTTSAPNSSVTTTVTTTEAPLITITLMPELRVQEVISYPAKTVYTVGEELDLSNISVKARYETRWFEAEGSRAGTMYGESRIYDDITLDPRNAIVRNDSSTWQYGDKFSTLEPGDYTVEYTSEASTAKGERIWFNSFRFPVTLKADSGIPQYSDVITVKDMETGELINNAILRFSTHIVYEIDGREVYTGPLYRYNTADANPVIYNYAKYKDAKSHSISDIYAEADGYTFVEVREDIRDGGTPNVTYMDVLMVKGNAVKGDSNCDGQVDMADAVLIMQALANPNRYGLDGTHENHITQQGTYNADADNNGLTNNDAQAIQKLLLGLIKSLQNT